jgi:hypothetical protein
VHKILLLALATAACWTGSAKDFPAVSPLHPRIYARADAATVGAGITVRELRARLHDPAFARWRLDIASGLGLNTQLEKAARYLEEGKQEDLDSVRDFLKTHTFSYKTHDVSGFLAGAEMAMAYDWIHAGLSEEDRKAILANIVTTVESSYSQTVHPEVNHNYFYMALNTVATCGLVLKGEPEPYNSKGEEYLRAAQKAIEDPGMVLDTWNAREGAWGEGSHYTFHETLRNVVMMLQAYRTASDVNYFERAQRDYGDFVVKAAWFMIGSTRPDLTFERTGDTSWSRAYANLTVPVTVEMMASGITRPEDAARVRSFARELEDAYGPKAVHSTYTWGMRMFADPKAAATPSYKTLPLAMRLGKDTYEQIVFRSGWGPDSSKVTIVAGDQFTDHQHFDKGQFLIYHHGGLAVDGGAYDGMYKPKSHSNDYAVRTLAHNCLLVRDPDEVLPKGYTNDGGQRIRRGMQHHSTWPMYVAHREKEGLDTGDVQAFAWDAKAGYGYVRANLKAAYSDKVTHYDRQFVYLPAQDSLVVFDRVGAANPAFQKRWLLHFLDQPAVDGKPAEPGVTRFAGAGLTTYKRSGELNLGARTFPYDGGMAVQSLLPLKREITTVGGPGFEFYNTFDGVNYPLSRNDPNAVVRESGNWRIEVAPSEPSKDDLFLNVLEIGAQKPVPATLVSSEGLVGAQIGSSIVLFGRNGTTALPVRYEVSQTGPATHYVMGFPSNQPVTVRVNGKARKAKTSTEGVLVLEDKGKGKRKIEIE